jgi:DNA-binding response OmpR family regulator
MNEEGKDLILVVEDDKNIADLIQLYLLSYGFRVYQSRDGTDIEQYLQNGKAKLVILDLMLPVIDGWEICRRIREKSDIPVIILTAKGDIKDKLLAFNTGADDYVVKPFDPLELMARVKAVLKRTCERVSDNHSLQQPGLSVDLSCYEVLVEGKKVELTPRETELLYFLASQPNQVFTREYLLKKLWGYDYPGGTRTVDVHINRLRDKLETPNQSWQIKTIWGVGYKFELKEIKNET